MLSYKKFKYQSLSSYKLSSYALSNLTPYVRHLTIQEHSELIKIKWKYIIKAINLGVRRCRQTGGRGSVAL